MILIVLMVIILILILENVLMRHLILIFFLSLIFHIVWNVLFLRTWWVSVLGVGIVFVQWKRLNNLRTLTFLIDLLFLVICIDKLWLILSVNVSDLDLLISFIKVSQVYFPVICPSDFDILVGSLFPVCAPAIFIIKFDASTTWIL